jgi:hypothetical protein
VLKREKDAFESGRDLTKDESSEKRKLRLNARSDGKCQSMKKRSRAGRAFEEQRHFAAAHSAFSITI